MTTYKNSRTPRFAVGDRVLTDKGLGEVVLVKSQRVFLEAGAWVVHEYSITYDDRTLPLDIDVPEPLVKDPDPGYELGTLVTLVNSAAHPKTVWRVFDIKYAGNGTRTYRVEALADDKRLIVKPDMIRPYVAPPTPYQIGDVVHLHTTGETPSTIWEVVDVMSDHQVPGVAEADLLRYKVKSVLTGYERYVSESRMSTAEPVEESEQYPFVMGEIVTLDLRGIDPDRHFLVLHEYRNSAFGKLAYSVKSVDGKPVFENEQPKHTSMVVTPKVMRKVEESHGN